MTPFEDIAVSALGADAFVDNWFPASPCLTTTGMATSTCTCRQRKTRLRGGRPGAAQIYCSGMRETPPSRKSRRSGRDHPEANSTGVAACDLDNDGYQDLYVASYGRIGDDLDYRSVDETPGLRDAVMDHIFRNNGDGTFEDVTEEAVEKPNILSALSIACADVNGDGWLDIYVGNRIDDDFLTLEESRHHGHYNVLYLNNRDFTFTEVTEEAGLLGARSNS